MGCLNSKKTKEKRKEREKSAIIARAKGAQLGLKAYHGGLSYEVIFDDRPITPFRGLTPKPGATGGRLFLSEEDIDTSLDDAFVKRERYLSEKTKFARECAAKREAVLEKKLAIDVEALIDDIDGAIGEEGRGGCAPTSSD